MARISRTAQALLGFLTWGPMSGYDLKKAIDGSIRNFWNESYGQIYPMLKSLTEGGLVEKHEEAGQGGRKRNVYSITEAGRRELQGFLDTPPELQPARNELLLKLFFGARGEPARCEEHVESVRSEYADDLDRYAEIREKLEPAARHSEEARFWLMTLRQGERIAGAMLAWCDESLAELRAIAQERERTP